MTSPHLLDVNDCIISKMTTWRMVDFTGDKLGNVAMRRAGENIDTLHQDLTSISKDRESFLRATVNWQNAS
jgi:hypothetical protein